MVNLSLYPQHHQCRTWYGLTATIILVSRFGHKAGLGRWVVFHPAAVNWLLRKGLSVEDAMALSLRHEFGHIQTLPLVLLYAGALVLLSANVTPWIRWPALLIDSQAVWEMMAELFTWAGRIEFYQACYAGVPRSPRILFWLLASATAAATAFLLTVL